MYKVEIIPPMRLFPLLFLVLSLAATVNDPLRISLTSGYRNDRLHWHLQDGGSGLLTYSELYRNLQFWDNGLNLRAIYRDLAFFVEGSYAAFGRGELYQKYSDLSFTSTHPHFQFHTHGWGADTLGYFSYAVDLTPDRTYRVLFLPLVGISGHFERLWSRNGSPQIVTSLIPSTDTMGDDSYSLHSSVPAALHLTWYGPFLGAAFRISPGNRLHFDAGYSYHWLNQRFRTQYQEEITFFHDEMALPQETLLTSIHAKGNGNIGQSGWAQMEIAMTQVWRLGFGASVRYFSTTLLPATVTQYVNGTKSTTDHQKLKARWTPISGWLTISAEI